MRRHSCGGTNKHMSPHLLSLCCAEGFRKRMLTRSKGIGANSWQLGIKSLLASERVKVRKCALHCDMVGIGFAWVGECNCAAIQADWLLNCPHAAKTLAALRFDMGPSTLPHRWVPGLRTRLWWINPCFFNPSSGITTTRWRSSSRTFCGLRMVGTFFALARFLRLGLSFAGLVFLFRPELLAFYPKSSLLERWALSESEACSPFFALSFLHICGPPGILSDATSLDKRVWTQGSIKLELLEKKQGTWRLSFHQPRGACYIRRAQLPFRLHWSTTWLEIESVGYLSNRDLSWSCCPAPSPNELHPVPHKAKSFVRRLFCSSSQLVSPRFRGILWLCFFEPAAPLLLPLLKSRAGRVATWSGEVIATYDLREPWARSWALHADEFLRDVPMLENTRQWASLVSLWRGLVLKPARSAYPHGLDLRILPSSWEEVTAIPRIFLGRFVHHMLDPRHKVGALLTRLGLDGWFAKVDSY